MGKYDNYQFRCSALGKIVSKSGKLTDTSKTYINEVFIGDVNNVQKEISSKYFEKGKFCEEDGITLLNDTLYKGKLLLKNKERKRNTWIHGESDCISPDGYVYDIKNAFDKFTFGKAKLSWEYEWQLKGYCMLWELNKARLFYCLNDMPEHLLVDEERKLFYKGGYVTYESPDYRVACEELRKLHDYSNMELWERFKVWDVDYTKDDEKVIIESVKAARRFMNELYIEREEQLLHNRQLMGLEPTVAIAHHDPEVNATIIEPGTTGS